MKRKQKIILTLGACLLIAVVAGAIIWLIRNTEPEAEQGAVTRKSAALISVVTAERGDFRPEVVALGTVEPARTIALSARIAGEIIEVAEGLKPGRFVETGEVIMKIDPRDFENAVALREGALREAEAALAIEEGRRAVAEQEFALLGESIEPSNRALVLREPQIASAEARVAAAQAALDQARLDLERTTIRAPFDGQILEQMVNLGSQVSVGEPLVQLTGTEEYWIRATVPVASLQWMRFPGEGGGADTAARARVRNRSAWAPGVEREARLASLIGSLDTTTRLARILLTVDDPLSQESDEPPLILDSLVEVRIEGRLLEDVARLDRAHLRGQNTVWLLEDGALAIKPVDVLFQDPNYVYITGGVEAGDTVVTTNLATVAEGLALRVEGSGEAAAE